MKKKWIFLFMFVIIMAMLFLIYPHIEFQKNGHLIACRYSDDISEFEDEVSLDECYTYDADRDITITGFDFHKILCFYVLILDYEEGNLIETQYILEEDYIRDFLKNAVIEENPNQVDLAALIEGKTAVVSNTRYVPQDDDTYAAIFYTLHEEYQVMFVYESNGLLVIQVGYPDEGPKYIAYQ